MTTIQRSTANRASGDQNERHCDRFDRPGGKRAPARRDPDVELVARAQRGDKQAFGTLMAKYQRRLAWAISRIIRDHAEVEDVTQEAFIKAYRALPAFRGESGFFTWLYRIGVNTAKNYRVALSRRPPMATEIDAEDAESFDDAERLREISTPIAELSAKQVAETIHQSLRQLPADLRTAIILREIEGMSYDEIGRRMKCPIGTVRSRIFRAREAVADEIRPMLETPHEGRW